MNKWGTFQLTYTFVPTRVAFISKNCMELVVLMSACSTLRIPCVGLDYTADMNRKLACLELINADLLVYSQEFEDEVTEIASRFNVHLLSIEEGLREHLNRSESEFYLPTPPRPFLSLTFTSGTTSNPKATVRKKSFDVQRFSYLSQRFQFGASDKFLLTVPMYHASALGWARLFLSLGGCVTLTEVDDAVVMYQDILHHGITAMLVVPPMLENLIEVARLTNTRWKLKLKFIISGGKHLSTELKTESIACFGPIVHEYYGTTETGINTIADSSDILNYPTSSGRPIDGCDIVIVDEQGQNVGFHTPGRIAACGYQNMDGYLDRDHETMTLDGEKSYILTADYGYLAEDRRLYVMTRDNIAIDGRQVDVYSIENRVRCIEGVRDVHLHWHGQGRDTDTFSCFISLREPTDVSALYEKMINCVPDTQIRLEMVPVDKIPYSLSGKVQVEKLLHYVNSGC